MKASRIIAAGVAATAVAVPVLATGPASAQYNVGTGPITISAKATKVKGQKFPDLSFSGPSKVSAGAKLTVKVNTSFKAVGPHTFSLVKPSLLPKSAKAQRKCAGEKGLTGICLRIAKAHKVDFKTFKVSKPIVDTGGKGWETAFGKKGDTTYLENKGDKQTRIVTAEVGSTLTFFCAVHPNMVKKVKVVS